MKLVDHRAERAMLDRLVEAVCAGQTRALVLCGEPGVGKTALLERLARRAAECRVVQTAGVESEMELAFAGLHVPATHVTVVFHELSRDAVYTGGVPASPVLVSSWVREGHPADDTTRLATEIAAAVTRITGVAAEQVVVVIQPGPARFAVEGGRVLPDAGHEDAWIAQDSH